jgi:GNAT superfamily N-acetyltransferase
MVGSIAIKLLGPGDESLVEAGAELFDDPPIPEQTRAFLASERDLLWFALAEGRPVGFVSANVLLHPDKLPHLFVNELATAESHRRRGIATRLMQSVVDFGRERALWPVWVAAEGDDDQAQAFYRSLSGKTERGAVVFEWE